MPSDSNLSGTKRESSSEPSTTIPNKKIALDTKASTIWDPTKNTILVITKAKDNRLVAFTRELAEWLIFTPRFGKKNPFIVYVDAHLQNSKRFGLQELIKKDSAWKTNLKFWTPKLCYQNPNMFHLVITLGGDGTILFTSTIFQTNVPPIMPFHLGSLGFLTPFAFVDHRNELTSLFEGRLCNVTRRMRLSCTIYRYRADPYCLMRARRGSPSGTVWTQTVPSNDSDVNDPSKWELMETSWMRKIMSQAQETQSSVLRPDQLDENVMCYSTVPSQTFHVLNEIVVDRGPNANISMLELFGDESHLTTVQADGLCIATATGSTAYSLSANGSLTHPSMNCTLVTPVCPHTLSFRPMLLPSSVTIRIVVPFGSRNSAYCRFDGRNSVELKQGDHVKITMSPYHVDTYCSYDTSNDWFSSVQTCLQWNFRQRQKSFVVVEGEEKPDPQNKTVADKRFACLSKKENIADNGLNRRSPDIQDKAMKEQELEQEAETNFDLVPWTEEELQREHPFEAGTGSKKKESKI